MSTISKVFVVLNLVFALFLVGVVSAILSHGETYKARLEKEQADRKTERDDLTAQLGVVRGEKTTIEASNRSLENQKKDVESELQAAKSTAESLRNDNNQLRGSVEGINTSLKLVQSDLADVQARNKALMDANDQYRKAAADAETAKMNAEDDRARIEGELQRANDDAAEKERQLAAITATRDNLVAEREALVKIGLDPAALIGNTVPLIEGKVADVGPNFVVLSVGENEGVKIGFPFDVYRGGDYIGRVIVDNVLPDSSTARVTVKNKIGLDFRALDNATTRL